VAMIFGLTGACRRDEMYNMKLEDVQVMDSLCVVKIPNTKTNVERTFTIENKYLEVINLYIKVRPDKASSNNFFLNYRKGKCINQVIGRNTIGKMPEVIATFLQLPNAKLYTGHSFKRASATLLADAGAGMTVLKRHGGLRSSNVAEGYIENSLQNKRKISN